MICFIIKVRPFESKNTHRFEIYNELTILVASYLVLANVELLEDETIKINIGWFITGFVALNILANFANILIKTVKKLI